ncbi:hypothetical protein C8Q78DRAFT_139122 [Trametes maxima]|nr:hypothetical protein C8Q78DRAFT_139122 [Trametes maxima]
MRGLSYLYQGNDLDGEVQASFIKREFLRPSESLVERYLPLMPHLTTTYSYVELGERYAAKNENTVWIKFKMKCPPKTSWRLTSYASLTVVWTPRLQVSQMQLAIGTFRGQSMIHKWLETPYTLSQPHCPQVLALSASPTLHALSVSPS